MIEKKPHRIIRDLTEEERKLWLEAREQSEAERPEITAMARAFFAGHDLARELIAELKSTRKQQGLSLADLMERSGMSRETISRLENDPHPNPTVRTLVRYATAVGVELHFSTQTPAAN